MYVFYQIILFVSLLIIRLLSLFKPKLKKFINGRKHLIDDLKKMLPQEKSLIWFHCASLGEFEQGRPLMEHFKKKYPQKFILLTFYSPSGYEVMKNVDCVDYVTYLPFDFNHQVNVFLDLIKPEKVVFVKYEFWPVMLRALRNRRVNVYLVAAIFRENQIFFKAYGGFMKKALMGINHFFVQDLTSKKLLNQIGISNVKVVGDSRFDRVLAIRNNDNKLGFMDALKQNAQTLFIAGSTWPKDHDCLVSFINTHLLEGQKILIAPHEINTDKIRDFISRINKRTCCYSSFKDDELEVCQVFILDTVGLLTKVYSYADFAYVGGGLSAGGVHNVLEPAVFGVPVVFGPVHQKYNEAVELKKEKGALVVENQIQFDEIVLKLYKDQEYRKKIGEQAYRYVEKCSGATVKIASFFENQIL